MKMLLNIDECLNVGKDQVGGKTYCLAKINSHGIRVPKTFCVPCKVYDDYLNKSRLKDRIFFEINRKSLEQMRWEEIWDTSLRIRNYFLITPIPEKIEKDLAGLIDKYCGNTPVAVRSSAPGEDESSSSFAGLHDSFLNVSGTSEIIKHIKLVWASLYSDAALLYRKELGLDIQTSRMAVVIQELIPSDRSGVFFGLNPSSSNESVIESVYGLNQALVDGDIDPDRWILSRSTGKLIRHTDPVRKRYAAPGKTGIVFYDLKDHEAKTPPLSQNEIHQIWKIGNQLEQIFGKPQDVEWTITNGELTILQARPITSTGFTETDDKRSWYLTLHRSYENLKKLYDKIEHHLIPKMISEADKLNQQDLEILSAESLCAEIERRQKIYDDWVKIYWADFIPFAHGIRLFGQVYNDAVTPEDPYEFMNLLENTGLKSMERNSLIEKLAQMIRNDTGLKIELENERMPDPSHPFRILLDSFVDQFGDLSCTTGSGSECGYGENAIIQLLLEFAGRPAKSGKSNGIDKAQLKDGYIKSFPVDRRDFAKEVLYLGRESYRLRDDDNIHLGRIEAGLFDAVQEGRRRLIHPGTTKNDIEILLKVPALSLEQKDQSREENVSPDKTAIEKWISSRQIVGHPAGPGISSGRARLIKTPQDLLSFKQGDVLVCQGVDPNMTFVVPLAAAVVEERGGMLIHGAIIAREYGLPCITGASNAMQLIENGNQITVDGYLGIITCQTEEL